MSFPKNIIWSPESYAETAVLAREVGDEMLARLDWMAVKPKVILDVGCGVGEMSAKLQTRYPDALVLAMDISQPMIEAARQQTSLPNCVCADSEMLPLPDQSVDLLYANFLLPWYTDLKNMLSEWRRVLRPDGLLMFSALGPDTLREWRDIFQQKDMPPLIDMHDVGDILLQTGFADPVLDVDHFTMTYREKSQLIYELRATGMLANDETAESMPETGVDKLEVTFEVVYAHTWAPEVSSEYSASADGVVRVPLAQLKNALKVK